MKNSIHPVVQILIWVLLTLLLQRINASALFLCSVGLFVVTLKVGAQKFLTLLRRTRWVLFSLLLIYGYTTPGVALVQSFGLASPTREGVFDGLMQLGRLLCALAGLAILLSRLSQAQLMGGIVGLMSPLCWLGISRERFAVRLALTLENAEVAMQKTASHWHSAIADALVPTHNGVAQIELRMQAWRWLDTLLLFACMALLMGAW
ncbi:MAG: hypothetical protein HOO97_01585 [Sideroxydans sp.]|nr:hypothetical protein [Sideroxydans sp.]